MAEVGLTRHGVRLMEPWGAAYRLDLVAVLGNETHLIEVKGTKADLVREDLTKGKWVLPLHGFRPWLAIDESMEAPAELRESWGLLKVGARRTRVVREPPVARDEGRDRSLEVLARILCMQSLPTLMGLSRAGKMAVLETEVDRPWRRWLTEPRVVAEEPGSVL